MKDPKSLSYFYRSYDNQAIEYVSLDQFDLNARTIKKVKVQGKQEKQDFDPDSPFAGLAKLKADLQTRND